MLDDETKQKIRDFYMKGQGSIQDYARIYRVSVEEVLEILGLNDMIEVETQGDLIDQGEAGPEVKVNPRGNPARSNYTTN